MSSARRRRDSGGGRRERPKLVGRTSPATLVAVHAVAPEPRRESSPAGSAPTTRAATSSEAFGLERWTSTICAVVALLVAYASIPGARDFCLDDAWIHLSYAKSVRLGDGLSYNPGDWETGASSPLWVLALAIWPIPAEPVRSVMLLGALFHAGTAAVTSSAAACLARSRATNEEPIAVWAVALLAGLLTAAMPMLVQGATSGMEVPLCALLISAVIHRAINERAGQTAILSALAVWARPEALLFVAPLSLAWSIRGQLRVGISMFAGASAALGAWITYCLLVSGWPWPNTRYVKAPGLNTEGIGYLLNEVLPSQPWLISLGGAALVGLALWHEQRSRRSELLALILCWGAAMVAIAMTRTLHEGVLFFEARYFAPLCAVPAIVVALGCVDRRPWLLVACTVPIAIMSTIGLAETHAQQRRQEENVRRLHTAPALYIAQHLPAEAVVAVEGAGATRFFTPREMTIVDMLGLNHSRLAHAESDAQRACRLADTEPGWLLLPEPFIEPLSGVFILHEERVFEDLDFAQVREAHPMRVVLFRSDGLSPRWAQRCRRVPPGTE